MANVEVSIQPIQTLTQGGYCVTVTDTGVPKRLRVSDINTGIVKANSALQPVAVGTAAYSDVEDFAPMSMMVDIATALDAILAGGD